MSTVNGVNNRNTVPSIDVPVEDNMAAAVIATPVGVSPLEVPETKTSEINLDSAITASSDDFFALLQALQQTMRKTDIESSRQDIRRGINLSESEKTQLTAAENATKGAEEKLALAATNKAAKTSARETAESDTSAKQNSFNEAKDDLNSANQSLTTAKDDLKQANKALSIDICHL